MEKGLNLLPPLLLLMLKTLVPNVKQQISIGQCITKAAKPRSFLPPVLFGLGVEMDHMFGSRWLIDELFRLGFSMSYNEVNRFRQAVVQSESIEQLLPETFPGSFSQWVAGNVNHNLASIDDCGSFHGMGVMVISTPTKNSTGCVASQNAIKKIKTVRSKELIANKGIPIKFYQAGLKSALSSFVMRPTVELQIPYTLPGKMISDDIWHYIAAFNDLFPSRPSWSGFMQSLSTDRDVCKSEPLFLPLIDLKSTDETCIYSTLSFVQDQAKKLNIITPCITFDQPLWLKAVEIVLSKKMNMVCRLGGFHTIMSFLGSVGKLMSGLGLSELLETCYGANTVIQMMSGRAVARALRWHMLVESALVTQLLKAIIPKSNKDEDNLPTASEFEDSAARCLKKENTSQFVKSEDECLQKLIEGTSNIEDAIMCMSFNCLQSGIELYKQYLSNVSRTAKLWLQYLH